MRYPIASLAAVVTVSLVIPAAVHAEDAADFITRARAGIRKCMDDNAAGDQRRFAVDSDQALADCGKALEIDPKSAEVYSIRGRVWTLRNEYTKALADCDKAVAINPKLAEAYGNRADALLQTNTYDKALADCEKALALDPKLAEACFTRASVFWRKGETERAITGFKNVLTITPDDWRALNDLGVLHWTLAQKQDARVANARLSDDLETAKTWREKSAALKVQAKEYWERGVSANPRSSDIHSNLGYAYAEADDLDKAEFHLRKAVEVKDIAPRAHNNLGRVLLLQSYKCEANAREAEAKAKSDPAEAAKAKRLNEEAKAKVRKAIAEFAKSVQLDPTLLEAHLNLAGIYAQLEESDKAVAEYRSILRFEQYAETEPKNPELSATFSHAYFGMARIAIARKRGDEAIRNLEAAIKWNPNDFASLQLLARQRYGRGDDAEGEKVLRSWLSKLPPAARQNAVQQLAKQLDDAGNREAAEKAREAAKTVNNASPKQ